MGSRVLIALSCRLLHYLQLQPVIVLRFSSYWLLLVRVICCRGRIHIRLDDSGDGSLPSNLGFNRTFPVDLGHCRVVRSRVVHKHHLVGVVCQLAARSLV